MKQILLLLLLALPAVQAQTELNTVREKFRSFEYTEVILLTDTLLENSSYKSEELRELYVLKAVSHFALAQEDSARRTFYRLLKIDEDYRLDPVEFSPKIIEFFGKIRNEYELFGSNRRDPEPGLTNSVNLREKDINNNEKALWRSILLPGWGHLYNNNSTAGWLLTVLSGTALCSAVYFTIDAAAKEKAYLNESSAAEIESKYNDYNKAYKLRNISYAAYGIVWGYAQIDLMFYSDNKFAMGLQSEPVNNEGGYFLSFKYSF